MRALLLATGDVSDSNPMMQRHLVPMLPLLDRPFVQHVIEYCIGQGVNEFDIVLSHLPEVLERHLGDGARWGCRVTYHLARDPAFPFGVFSRLGLELRGGSRLLLGHADRLPIFQIPPANDVNAASALLFVSGRHGLLGHVSEWTGWSLMHARDLRTIARDLPAARLFGHLRSSVPDVRLAEVSTVLSVRTPAELLAAERAMLDKKIRGLMFRGREKAPGVWVARSAAISPKAELNGPLFIGPHSIVGAARLGPHAVIGPGCLVDRHCRIRNSSVFAGTYVGEGMELDGVVVDGELAVTPTAGATRLVVDPLHLGRVPEVSLTRLILTALPRLAALVLFVATAPLLIFIMAWLALFRRGRIFHGRDVVRVPLASVDGSWPTYRLNSFVAAAEGAPVHQTPGLSHLLLSVLPGLLNVVRGDVGFVGVSSRSPAEVSRMAEEWRSLYLHSKAGLIATTTFFSSAPREEDRCAADAAYACNRTWRPWRQDVAILVDYLCACLGLPGRRTIGPELRSPEQDESDARFRLPTGFAPAEGLTPAVDQSND